jgi:hypothetical protein
MNNSYRQHARSLRLPRKQRGALTIFSAVLILILLTGMVIYAAQVGVFEQRKSGNELRQKQAFHSAEVGIQRGQEYLLAYVNQLTSQKSVDGWLSETLMPGGTGRWVSCEGAYSADDRSHPCWGEALDGDDINGDAVDEPNLRDLSYFYSEDGANPTPIPIPIADNQDLMDRATEAAEVFALLCMLDVDAAAQQPVQGCLGDDQRDLFDPVYFVVTLLARGRSECDEDGDCLGEALIVQRMGSYGPVPFSKGPGVPLTSQTRLHPGGTVEIVPNPNGGGLGVPVSVWIDGDESGNSQCNPTPGEPEAIDPQSNSWATCEFHEWYGVDAMPADYTCPQTPCDCSTSEQLISRGNQDGVRFDIVIDPDFPEPGHECDLFGYIFGYELTVDEVKAGFPTIISDCSELGPESEGPIWVTSDQACQIAANRQIGSPGTNDDEVGGPVFLVVSAPELQLGGGSTIYGVVMTTKAEGYEGSFDASGGGTVYGAVLVEGELEPNFGANFEIVWNDDLVRLATKRGSLGKLYGGWTDAPEDWR